MRGHLSYCCVLKGHHNLHRHCPPGSRGCAELSSAVPKEEDTGMGRGAGWEGELPLESEQQHKCWVPGCSSPSPHQPNLGSNSDRRRWSRRRALLLLLGTVPGPNVQLIVEDVQAGVEEKAGEQSNGDVWVLGRRKVLDFPLPASPHSHLVAAAQQKMLLGLSVCALWGPTGCTTRQEGRKSSKTFQELIIAQVQTISN